MLLTNGGNSLKIIHIESGLGNQMLDYCDLLACRYSNPEDKIYIETLLYEISECTQRIAMWNGYELNKVFGIQEENIRNIFSENQWIAIRREVTESKFWVHDWKYAEAITKAFISQGIDIKKVETSKNKNSKDYLNACYEIYRNLKKTPYGYYLDKLLVKLKVNNVNKFSIEKEAFCHDERNLYTGHFLKFMYKGSGIERIENEIRKKFTFPELHDKKNKEVAEFLSEVNSVSVHIRRGDFLKLNHLYYENGYFKRAVKFIKKNVRNPKFIIFCDSESYKWAKDNLNTLGFEKSDDIYFIDWNVESESYRDMQLMTLCKHNIITNSSFGWWGAYLNNNKDKITCSPHAAINTTHWF